MKWRTTLVKLGAAVWFLTNAVAVPANPILPTIPSSIFNITNYGAVGDGVATNTTAIQAALNAASAAAGGTVEIPAGTFLCGPLNMYSSTRLQIDSGGVLMMLPYGSYPPGGENADFITVYNAHDIEFAGPGVLNGQGGPWWTNAPTEADRPYTLHLENVVRVFIHDWNSVNPPHKHIVFDGTDLDITVQNATNTAPYPTPNTDCLNLQGSNCLIQNCVFSGGDDNIAMGRSSGSGVNILISNITCGTGHGISIGSITDAGISNVTVENCTFSGTDYGLRLKADNDRGGLVQNIVYQNITMTNVQSPICLYSYYNESSGNNVSPNTAAGYGPSNVTSLTPIWRNITFSNITSTFTTYTTQAGIIWGRPEMMVSNVTLYNVNISAPSGFDIYNATGVQFINSHITLTSRFATTFPLYSAQFVVSNTTLSTNPVTLSGLSSTTNWFSFYNTIVSGGSSTLYEANPLTLGGAILTNSLSLALPASTVLNYILGSTPTELVVAGNLTLGGTVNISAGSGFTSGVYTLCGYTGTLGGSLSLGAMPAGYTGSLNTSTPKQVNLVVQAAPVFSNLTPSQSIIAGTSAVTLSGTLSATGPIYPLSGETVTVTINGNAQSTTISDSAGDFSINYNSSSLPVSGTPYVISYGYAGDATFTGVTNSTTSLTVSLINQTISFGPLPNQTYGAVPFNVSATASSGLPVSFAVTTGPAAMTGNTVTVLGAGSVSIQATQAGNGTYNAAPAVTQPFSVFPLPVGLSGSRVYDTNNDAASSILSITNILGSDNVNLALGSAVLASASVGQEPITGPGTLALGGTAATNYTVTGLTGSVTISNNFAPFSITSATLQGTNLVLCWESVPGTTYNILTNGDLTTTNWVDIGDPLSPTGPVPTNTYCVALPGVTNTSVYLLIKQN